MNSFPRSLSRLSSNDSKFESLETMVKQLWDKNKALENKVKSIENENISLKNTVLNLKDRIDRFYGHTSLMPDIHGVNGDHDRRYQLKNELNYFPYGVRLGIWAFIPRSTYYLDVVWDTLYGTVPDSPVWSSPVDTYTSDIP